jgi:hypothetical protein
MEEIDQIVLGEADDAVEQGPLAPEPNAIAVAHLGGVFALRSYRIICSSARELRQSDD